MKFWVLVAVAGPGGVGKKQGDVGRNQAYDYECHHDRDKRLFHPVLILFSHGIRNLQQRSLRAFLLLLINYLEFIHLRLMLVGNP